MSQFTTHLPDGIRIYSWYSPILFAREALHFDKKDRTFDVTLLSVLKGIVRLVILYSRLVGDGGRIIAITQGTHPQNRPFSSPYAPPSGVTHGSWSPWLPGCDSEKP